MKTTYVSVDEWMDKEIMTYIYNRILFSLIKKETLQ